MKAINQMVDSDQPTIIADEASYLAWAESEPFIFVSYARGDRDFVYPEIERLKAEGYRIWYDKDEIQLGRSWSREIDEAIAACTCFLVFVTQPDVRLYVASILKLTRMGRRIESARAYQIVQPVTENCEWNRGSGSGPVIISG